MIKRLMPVSSVAVYLSIASMDSKINEVGKEWIVFGLLFCSFLLIFQFICHAFDEAEK